MAVKVIQAKGRACRVFRFPPLCASPRAQEGSAQVDQASLQQAASAAAHSTARADRRRATRLNRPAPWARSS